MSEQLVVIRIARRMMAVVVLRGLHIELSKTQSLPTNREAAITAAKNVVRWVTDNVTPSRPIVLDVPIVPGTRLHEISEYVKALLAAEGVDYRERGVCEIADCFVDPARGTREEVRRSIAAIVHQPHLPDVWLDALALGLHAIRYRPR
jgi:hypothetical protein